MPARRPGADFCHMKTVTLSGSVARISRGFAALSFALIFLCGLRAQAASSGTIEGRVFDAGRGEYLEQARLVIEGTGQETFTDSSGQYRFSNVPAGEVK